ncbi:MAG: nucleoside:proton symporter [Gammaproteobacteria bacterium]|nr:nucleoside:proton symporter [Gammaproteobacteria bacterium]
MQGVLGFISFIAIAWLISTARSAIRWHAIWVGLVVQIALVAGLLYLPGTHAVFNALNMFVTALQSATVAGTSFVFGYLGGGPPPFTIVEPGHRFIFVFGALPLVIVISALTALLTYWGILPWLIGGVANALRRSFKLSGAVGFGAAANIFLGMVEAPLFVRPYLARMTKAELFVLMTTGMSTIAGTVLVLYATILGSAVPDALGHLLIASVVNVPAGIVFALLIVPETSVSADERWDPPRGADSAMEALANGASSGLTMCLQISAMLLVFISLVHLINFLLANLLPDFSHLPLSLERLFGLTLAPVAWLMGIPWSEAVVCGQLLGTKTILNEMLAYLELAKLGDGLSAHSRLIVTYALCGFANVGSLGIMIAGLGELAPTRRADVLALGTRAVLAGTLATFSTGTLVGLLATLFGA